MFAAEYNIVAGKTASMNNREMRNAENFGTANDVLSLTPGLQSPSKNEGVAQIHDRISLIELVIGNASAEVPMAPAEAGHCTGEEVPVVLILVCLAQQSISALYINKRRKILVREAVSGIFREYYL